MPEKYDAPINKNILCEGIKKEICNKPPPTKNFKIVPYSEKPREVSKTSEQLSKKYGF
jgi:hypothetical protein